MKVSPLFTGIVYLCLGVFFTIWAIQLVNKDGWGFFSYFLLIIATFDIGGGIRLIGLHLRFKKEMNKKK